MSLGKGLRLLLGLAALVGGFLTLAFTQVSVVLPEGSTPGVDEFQGSEIVGQVEGVIFSAVLITLGVLILLATASSAPLLGRILALTAVGIVFPLFFIAQTLLFINGIAAGGGPNRGIYFSASYFFHAGHELSFAAVYALFFFTFFLLILLLAALGYLLFPQRLFPSLWNWRSWPKTEAIHIAANLFLLLSLGVLFFYLLRLAAETDPAALQGRGLLAQNLLIFYYLISLFLFLLILTVSAHTFLLNWGSQTPLKLPRLIENLRTMGRVERGLLFSAAALNAMVLLAPTLPSRLDLSQSFAFDVSPRGFSYLFYFLLLPYLPYWMTQRRLVALLESGRGWTTPRLPFTETSLRLVLSHVLGLAALTTLGVALHWEPLLLMIAFAAWTSSILFFFSVRFDMRPGLPRLAFRDEASPPLYFVFLALALTTGLMLWGLGNTFEVSYLSQTATLEILNEAQFGYDILARIAGTIVLVGTLLLTLDLGWQTHRVNRRFLGHYLALFLSIALSALFAFTVGVWTRGEGGRENAYTGFAFHQYYQLEAWGVGLLLTGTLVYSFFALHRIVGPMIERKPEKTPSIHVEWSKR